MLCTNNVMHCVSIWARTISVAFTPATHVLSNSPSFLSMTNKRAVKPMDILNVILRQGRRDGSENRRRIVKSMQVLRRQ